MHKAGRHTPTERLFMPITANELLELNADLMMLIREKQEQGALADAISLQILLHKNLMRLRQFLAAPDQPIPDAPRDWMPPVSRSDTPPAGENDNECDSADDAQSSAGKGKGKQRQQQQRRPPQSKDVPASTSSGAAEAAGGSAGEADAVRAGGLPAFGGAISWSTTDICEDDDGVATDGRSGQQSGKGFGSLQGAPSPARRKYNPRKKNQIGGGGGGGEIGGDVGAGRILFAGMLPQENTASHIPSSIPLMPTPISLASGGGRSGREDGAALAAPPTSGLPRAASPSPGQPLPTPSSSAPVAGVAASAPPTWPPPPPMASSPMPAPAMPKASAPKRRPGRPLKRPPIASAPPGGRLHAGRGGSRPAFLAPAPLVSVAAGGADFRSSPFVVPFFPPYGVSPFAGASFAGAPPFASPASFTPSPFGAQPLGAPPLGASLFGALPFTLPYSALPVRPLAAGAGSGWKSRTFGGGVRRPRARSAMDPGTAAEIRQLRTAALLSNSRRNKCVENDDDLEVDVEGDDDEHDRGGLGARAGGETGNGRGGGGGGGEWPEGERTRPSERGEGVATGGLGAGQGTARQISHIAAPAATTTPAARTSSLSGESRQAGDGKSREGGDDEDDDEDDFCIDEPSGARGRGGARTATTEHAGGGGAEDEKGGHEGGGGPVGGGPRRAILAQPWTPTGASRRTAALDPPAVSNFGFDDEAGGSA